ncbi:uncharacterized protein HMPREF1541_01396 [Cyphellophora europaea CBS 101466]|uniref:Nuclear rim protein 1 n=1 Tax=Cyphellophora europaea (strain CBS 101466) TaxID=1220924 RepID=W2SEZ3_CYPE1|nr:uncharacterized protein HMPREF1541_01396 [Cyphellophora europaea CBS 101466]ETN47205.1 hypothetical protein HMPREF1541_01396 [Cyphellophora europaea CBS 101466]
MPKFVRRQPLTDRIAAYLNPYDFLLWLSEEIESRGYDQLEKEWAIPVGFTFNLILLIARANTSVRSSSYDDVFGDGNSFGWRSWLATFIVHCLTLISVVNAAYTFWRRKTYRLFENDIDNVPNTPSARRVRLDSESSPVASSPLRFMANILGTETARARAHPDAKKDVWEIAVWDPLPICLRLFCYFSPGHVFVYWLFLPTLATEPRPSLKVFTAVALAVLLSLQLSVLQTFFSQQAKDSAFISKEVLHEYDTKYVRPRTQPLYRDVGIQFHEQARSSDTRDARYNVVQTYTPMVNINRGFKISPNPNYISHPELQGTSADEVKQRTHTSEFVTPAQNRATSPGKPLTAVRQPNFRPASQGGDGGSLGVYSHAASPLKKSASTNFTPVAQGGRSSLSPEKRIASPGKRMSVPPGGLNSYLAQQRMTHLQSSGGRRESGRF